MRTPFLILIIALLSACSGGGDKQTSATEETAPQVQPRTVSVSSPAMSSITALLGAYYDLKDALVEYDTSAANTAAASLSRAADTVNTDGISDTTLAFTIRSFAGTVAAEAKALAGEPDLVEKKRSFSMITENIYPLLQSVQYNEGVVYHQMCPMAFNDTETAFWLSRDREVVNPYLGKKHPKYASGMLHCGEVKDSLAFGK